MFKIHKKWPYSVFNVPYYAWNIPLIDGSDLLSRLYFSAKMFIVAKGTLLFITGYDDAVTARKVSTV